MGGNLTRIYTLKAHLNFQIDNHAEFTSLRTSAQAFAAARNGTCFIQSSEKSNSESDYKAFVQLILPCSGRTQANTYMAAIDNALPTLPTLTTVNGEELWYDLHEAQTP